MPGPAEAGPFDLSREFRWDLRPGPRHSGESDRPVRISQRLRGPVSRGRDLWFVVGSGGWNAGLRGHGTEAASGIGGRNLPLCQPWSDRTGSPLGFWFNQWKEAVQRTSTRREPWPMSAISRGTCGISQLRSMALEVLPTRSHNPASLAAYRASALQKQNRPF